jgi:hypothetical protein
VYEKLVGKGAVPGSLPKFLKHPLARFATTVSKFEVVSPQVTKYVSEQDFNFKGLFNKVVGLLLQREFKQQTLRHMQGFKRFVEEAALKQGSLL